MNEPTPEERAMTVDLKLTKQMHVPTDHPVSDTRDHWCNHCKLLWPCDARQLADEVELGNSSILKQIEVNAHLRAEKEKLVEALGDAASSLEAIVDRKKTRDDELRAYAFSRAGVARAALDGQGGEGDGRG